jgi:hypothetical protein
MMKILNLEDYSRNQANFQEEEFKSEDEAYPCNDDDGNSTLDLPMIEHDYKRTNLKHLVNYIHGDIYHCAICSSKFEEPNNMPRVLFCGDCLCEKCIK